MNIARFGPPGLKWFSGNVHPRPHGRGYYMTARRAYQSLLSSALKPAVRHIDSESTSLNGGANEI